MKLLLLVLFSFTTILKATEYKLPYDYPLETCLSCGDALGDAPAILINGGRQLKFCCLDCVGSYTKSPETMISNLEEQIKISQRDKYPLKTCVISSHELGSMGEPVEWVHGNTLVKFCCGACIEKFEVDPDKFLQMINPDSSGLPAHFIPRKP